MAFKPYSNPTRPYAFVASSTDAVIERIVRAQFGVWEKREVPLELRRAAAKLATAWVRPTLAWHLELLRGLLPSTTLAAIEVPLAERLTRKALDDMAERWLASAMGGYPPPYAPPPTRPRDVL